MTSQWDMPPRPAIDDLLVALRTDDLLRSPGRSLRQPAAAPRAIRGLLLEAGNVLYDDTDWRRWLLRVLLRMGVRVEYGSFFFVFDRDYLGDVYCGRKAFDEAIHTFLLSVGLSAGQAEEVCRALESHRRCSETGNRPLIGVRETLAELHAAGVTLGLLCNSEYCGDALRGRLANLVGDFPWNAVVSSRDLGCAMPAAACYNAALTALGLPAADVAFVGCGARELRGARMQGLTTIAFNAEADAHADIDLEYFEDLVELTRFSPPHPAQAA